MVFQNLKLSVDLFGYTLLILDQVTNTGERKVTKAGIKRTQKE